MISRRSEGFYGRVPRFWRIFLAGVFCPLTPQLIVFQAAHRIGGVQPGQNYLVFWLGISYLYTAVFIYPIYIFLLRSGRTNLNAFFLSGIGSGFIATIALKILFVLLNLIKHDHFLTQFGVAVILELGFVASLFGILISGVFWLISRPDIT